jgi:hypothetical protein
MRTKLERHPNGCWALWEPGGPASMGAWRVAAEGRWWPVGVLTWAWWRLTGKRGRG